ncbi:hypothetical protein J5275_16770 [Rhizobium sp. L245/93]|nr:hypothetical protein [Rhizobium sp. L245/93]MBO9170034.1 hypothetical protein [Rhizobium sp. L245/93]
MFDVLELLKRIFGELYIPQSVMDDLAVLKGFDTFDDHDTMLLSFRDGQFFRDELTAEQFATRQTIITERLTKIADACTVLPTAVPNERNPIAEVFIANCGAHVMDHAALATKGHLLLSEDLHYRQIAAAAWSVRGAWLQAVFQYAHGAGLIKDADYRDLVTRLAIIKHGHLAVTSPLLVDLFNSSDDQLREFDAVADFIGTQDAQVLSHCNVVVEFLNSVDALYVDGARFQTAVETLLDKLIRYQPSNGFLSLAYVASCLYPNKREALRRWMVKRGLSTTLLWKAMAELNARMFRVIIARITHDPESVVQMVRRHRARRSYRRLPMWTSPPSIARSDPRREIPSHKGNRRKSRSRGRQK